MEIHPTACLAASLIVVHGSTQTAQTEGNTMSITSTPELTEMNAAYPQHFGGVRYGAEMARWHDSRFLVPRFGVPILKV